MGANMVKMKAAPGSTVVSFGNELYRVDADGTLDVPEDAAQVLLSHGFEKIDVPVIKMPRGRPRKAREEEMQTELM
jgi:hypothetical protein